MFGLEIIKKKKKKYTLLSGGMLLFSDFLGLLHFSKMSFTCTCILNYKCMQRNINLNTHLAGTNETNGMFYL